MSDVITLKHSVVYFTEYTFKDLKKLLKHENLTKSQLNKVWDNLLEKNKSDKGIEIGGDDEPDWVPGEDKEFDDNLKELADDEIVDIQHETETETESETETETESETETETESETETETESEEED
jgi:hypothetical protein